MGLADGSRSITGFDEPLLGALTRTRLAARVAPGHGYAVQRLRRLIPVLTFFSLGACGVDAASTSPSDLPPEVPKTPESTPTEDRPEDRPEQEPETIAVAHERELRAAWIHYVWNGVWPSRSGMTQAEAKAELVGLFDGLAAARMNAVFLQVRTEGDALYPSALAPWARFLTGTMGQDPGWDPLAFAIDEAHARGIELHAWLNPYRALSQTSLTPPASHVTKRMPEVTVPWGTQIWLDPAAPEVRTDLQNVIAELLDRYDVDGIHFDDYFYPYPNGNLTFDDDKRFNAYVGQGGTLVRTAWRRQNVNTLVREVSEHVAQKRADARFGISPFGIYKPGVPEGIQGLDAYNVIACDPVTWIDEGWVDYLVPQLYWPTTREKQAFGKLVTWWASLARDGRSVFVGHDITKIGQDEWPLEEIELQMHLSRAERTAGKGLRGNVFFTARPLANDQLGLRTSLTTTYWPPATTPPLASALAARASGALQDPSAPRVVQRGAELTVTPGDDTRARAFAIYDRSGASPALAELVPARASGGTDVTLGTGHWAISVVDRHGLESRAVVVVVP